MTYNSTIALDLISESQSVKAATANALFEAMSPAALFGIKSVSGLIVNFYGGNIYIAGTPTAIATQQITLTASTTNYIYSTAAGVVTKTTSIPGSWPGPLAASAVALYDFVTGTATITSGNNYLQGLSPAGATGATGADGPAGADLAATRTRITTAVGASSTLLNGFGFEAPTTGGSVTARALGSGSLRESISQVAYVSSGSAGSSSTVYSPRNWCYLGNAAGRGGFTLGMRIPMESASAPANQRCFFGLIPLANLPIGNVEPDSLLSIIGIGALAGDANLSVIHNDGSGTATKVPLGSNFPARATDNVYELVLTSVANSGTVDYTVVDMGTGNTASSTISSDLPANTVFLTYVAWQNNGSTAAATNLCFAQVVGETRY